MWRRFSRERCTDLRGHGSGRPWSAEPRARPPLPCSSYCPERWPPPGHRVGRTGPEQWPQLAQQARPSFHSQLSLTRCQCLVCRSGFYLSVISSFQTVRVWDPTREKQTTGREGILWAFRMSDPAG